MLTIFWQGKQARGKQLILLVRYIFRQASHELQDVDDDSETKTYVFANIFGFREPRSQSDVGNPLLVPESGSHFGRTLLCVRVSLTGWFGHFPPASTSP